MSNVIVGVDVSGTFTDLTYMGGAFIEPGGGDISIAEAPTHAGQSERRRYGGTWGGPGEFGRDHQ